METFSSTPGSVRSWWMALAALTVLGPWPGWNPFWLLLLLVCGGLLALARPRGWQWLPWLPVALALAVVLTFPGGKVDPSRLRADLDSYCNEMMAAAGEVSSDPRLHRLLAASGEAFRPEMPFEVLSKQATGQPGRYMFLADDRNRLVAWAGEQRAFPHELRPLGDRRWGISWTAGTARLFLREPIHQEGRLVGAVTVVEWTPLQASSIWGMRAPGGGQLRLGLSTNGTEMIKASGKPGIEIPVAVVDAGRGQDRKMVWIPWLVLAVLALILEPTVAWAAVLIGTSAHVIAPGPASQTALGISVLVAAAAVSRLCQRLPPWWARSLVAFTIGTSMAAALLGSRWELVSWLPSHLLRPGWGGVWIVAISWVVVGWPLRQSKIAFTLAHRLALASGLAGLGLLLELARLPVELQRAVHVTPQISLPRSDIDLSQILPIDPAGCRLDDLAPVLARRWHLNHWHTPSELLVVDADGREISRWGDIRMAGDAAQLMRVWDLALPGAAQVELWVATKPWSLLHDWRPGAASDAPWAGTVWYAVLSRSGTVDVTLHPQIRSLEAATAGDLFYSRGGWAFIHVGDSRHLARVWREADWLVVALARPALPSEWVVQGALACLWALIGLFTIRPPALRWGQQATFGGRLRLLVTGGIILPLVILTLFLQQRIRREEVRLEQAMGFNAMRAARYTAIHLAGGFAIDNELARWLSGQLGGEVVLFDGARVVAVSRPDLMAMGALPEVPAAKAFPHFQLGRNDPVVLRHQGRLTAVGAVELQGRRLLMQVFPVDPMQSGDAPDAVDWLLTGAVLAALLAMVLTSRVERRLSTSLRDLVSLSRRLHRGEPIGQVRQPDEKDLAEVLSAVQLMSEEVQQREQSLRHQEELLRITLATLVPAVMVLDQSNQVRFANPSAEQLRQEHAPYLLDTILEVAARSTQRGAPAIETTQPLPGEELTWRVGVADVPLPDGSQGLVAVVDDVTDVVRIDRLQQLNQMARIVAHEVKNPLTPIRLWMQELEEAQRRSDPDLEAVLTDACREISTQVTRLQATASSFSNLAALERWQPEPVDLGELAGETLQGFAVVERRGIELQRQLPDPGTAVVTGDRQWLRRAFTNLVKNSIDALGDDEGKISLRLCCKADEPLVEIQIEDSAGGVPDEQLNDLFSPSFSTTTAGSGLGLALVQQVVARCQGRVAASNGEHGLVVRIELPRAS
jgi:signal transduction histidine kinase